MTKSIEASAHARAWLVLAVVITAIACGGDDDDAGGAGFPSTGAGVGGTSGVSGAGAGGAGAGGAGAGGAGGAGAGGMDAGMRCGAMVCPAGQRCVNDQCVAPMCSGEPGEPVGGDQDAGVDEDAGVSGGDGREFEADGCPPNESCVFGGDQPVCRCGSGPGCPPDQACSNDGRCTCGGEACESGESCCGETCVDLDSDEDNCGRCGRACREGHVCRDGKCGCAEAGETLCGDTCVDLDSDERNCGECGERCPDGATCNDGKCVCADKDEIACDGECVPGNTEENCGECGERCEAPSTCRDPSGPRPLGCYCPNVNDVPCNGACVALGTTENCGACGDRCEGPANTCRNGSCQCPTLGQTACGDSCVDLNTGVDTDPGEDILITHCGGCGVTCLPGAACVDGKCDCPSASTTDMYCDEHPVTGATDGTYACIEVTTTKNCGDCGNACLDDSECRGSNGSDAPEDFACVCVGSDAGKTHCPGIGCRTLSNDEQNCGACGNVCPDNATCRSGTCDCPGGSNVRACMDDGEPTCVDTNTDENHCGACGNECAPGEECYNGDCVDADSAYDEDRLNCGACGMRCADTGCGFLGLFECECNNGVCQRQ